MAMDFAAVIDLAAVPVIGVFGCHSGRASRRSGNRRWSVEANRSRITVLEVIWHRFGKTEAFTMKLIRFFIRFCDFVRSKSDLVASANRQPRRISLGVNRFIPNKYEFAND